MTLVALFATPASVHAQDAPPGAAVPAAAPPAAAGTAAAEPAVDIEGLRREYFALRDRLFQSRARAQVVASAMYSSRLRIRLEHASGRHHVIRRATIRLDGASVFDDEQGVIARDRAPRYDGYVAPGQHTVAVRVEAVSRDDASFATVTDTAFSILVPGKHDAEIAIVAQDDGDIAYEWKRERRGSYKLQLAASVTTAPHGDGK
jgi:hypothetical protein